MTTVGFEPTLFRTSISWIRWAWNWRHNRSAKLPLIKKIFLFHLIRPIEIFCRNEPSPPSKMVWFKCHMGPICWNCQAWGSNIGTQSDKALNSVVILQCYEAHIYRCCIPWLHSVAELQALLPENAGWRLGDNSNQSYEVTMAVKWHNQGKEILLLNFHIYFLRWNDATSTKWKRSLQPIPYPSP